MIVNVIIFTIILTTYTTCAGKSNTTKIYLLNFSSQTEHSFFGTFASTNKTAISNQEPPDSSSKEGLKLLEDPNQKPRYNGMSCYVCSTMDYSNYTDNRCKNMSATEGIPVGNSVKPHLALGLVASSPEHDEDNIPINSYPGGDTTTSRSMDYSINKDNTTTQNPDIYMNDSDEIRTRSCTVGENFCSVVSVSKIEYVNDRSVSKFWALER